MKKPPLPGRPKHRPLWAAGFAAAIISAFATALAAPSLLSEDRNPALRAYPETIPSDVSFETVISSQPFPPVRYPVPIIGWKDHPEEIHVAPNGALVLPVEGKYRGLYVVPLVQTGPAGPPAPLDPRSAIEELVEGYMPGVRSSWNVAGIRLSRLAFATLLESAAVRTGRETLVGIARWTVKNETPREAPVRLHFRIGEAIPGLSLFKLPPNPPGTLRYKAFFVYDAAGKILMRCAVPARPAPLAKPAKSPLSFSTSTGPTLTVDLPLKPGEEKTVDLFVPYFPLGVEKAGDIERLAVEPQFDIFRDFWAHELNRAAQFIVPEKRVRDSVRACLAYSMILVDKDAKGFLRPHPDATSYEHVWAGDSGCIIQAADRLGYHDDAAAYLGYFLSRQGVRAPEGEVSSADGFFSGDVPGLRWMGENGFILWALAEHYKLTGDKLWLKRVAPQMIKSCDWIIRERARTKTGAAGGERPRSYGLLPKGRASDNDELNYFYWTDTYSYAGLRGTADIVADVGLDAEARRLRAEADDYRSSIRDSLERSILKDTDPPFVPQGPFMNQPPTAERLAASWYSLCSPVYMVEMGLIGPGEPAAAWTNQTIEKYVMTSGLPTLLRPGYIDPHYVYNQALAQLLRGEVGKFLWTFYSVFAYGQSRSTYATVECNDIVTGATGDAWDSLRTPHMHSNSRVLALVRIALLLEDRDTLHLLAGTPRGWLSNGKTIEVRRAPTAFGDAGLRLESLASRNALLCTIDPPARKTPRILLHLRPPSGFGVPKKITVNNKTWTWAGGETLDLGPLRARTVVSVEY